MQQHDLSGNIVQTTIDAKRVYIKVCGNSRKQLWKIRLKGYKIIESVEAGWKIWAVLVNDLCKEDQLTIIKTRDPDEIRKILSKIKEIEPNI
jgi:hypothetical protein